VEGKMRPLKIISGGQTGVDRAALDVAIDLGIPHGGYCPKGRRAEDGRIHDRYQLDETETAQYNVRTYLNILHADSTLIIAPSFTLSTGTLLTQRTCWKLSRACMVAVPGATHHADAAEWMRDSLSERDGERGTRVLNVAGPRESKWPDGYEAARSFLSHLIVECL
jgi:hypothetical protein